MSHSKRAGERTPALARLVKALLEARHGYRAFFDVDDLKTITLENLKAEIETSVVLLVIVDEVTFDSEWCREEVRFAAEAGVPVHTLIDKDRYPPEHWRTCAAEHGVEGKSIIDMWYPCLLYTSPSPRD